MKTLNQLLCGVHAAAAAEALAFAEKMGVDGKMALQILTGSAAASWMLRDRGPRMLQADPEVTSAVDIFVKDLGIVLDAGRDVKAALPLAAAAYQMFVSTSAGGGGRADDSQVIRSYRLLNGSRQRGDPAIDVFPLRSACSRFCRTARSPCGGCGGHTRIHDDRVRISDSLRKHVRSSRIKHGRHLSIGRRSHGQRHHGSADGRRPRGSPGWHAPGRGTDRFHPPDAVSSRLRSHLPESVVPYTNDQLGEAMRGADLVFLGVNSEGLDWAAERLRATLPPGVPVILLTKGLRGNGKSIEILPRVLEARLRTGQGGESVASVVPPSREN